MLPSELPVDIRLVFSVKVSSEMQCWCRVFAESLVMNSGKDWLNIRFGCRRVLEYDYSSTAQ